MTRPSQNSATELHLPAASPSAGGSREIENLVLHLFDQSRARLASYVLAFGLPRHDAEDIVQETFLSLFRHLELGRPQSNLNGWLFRVAHNLALKRRAANQALAKKAADETALAAHPCDRPSAEEEFAFNQTQRRLRAVVGALPEQDRRCLSLRAEGLKYREIAEVLGISLGGVSMSLARSLARIMRANGGE